MRPLAPLVAITLLVGWQGCASEVEVDVAGAANPDGSAGVSGAWPADASGTPTDAKGDDGDEPPSDAASAEADADADAPATGPDPKPGCTATATLAGHPVWMFFTRPDDPCTPAGSGRDSHILDELTRLIDSVPAGGRIDGHIYSISVDSVAQALLNAQARGVDVWISTDGGVAASNDSSKTAYLDKLDHKVYCTSASRSSCVSSAADAISHTKLFVFSSATAPDGAIATDVVWFGSANQTYASGMELYNNTVTIFGDDVLYTSLRGYLDDLYYRKTYADYYDPASGRGHLLAASASVYVSPEVQTDLVVNRLDDITPDDTCRVRVMQASIRDSRLAVVNRLVALKQGGCKIWVVAETVEPSAASSLSAAGIPVKKMPIHDKSFIVYAKYGSSYEYRVYTGSHNLSGSAAHKYDEIFVKLAPETGDVHPIYDAYYVHFNDAYDQ